jgi:thiol-disulfide isomerase/thioredoxin
MQKLFILSLILIGTVTSCDWWEESNALLFSDTDFEKHVGKDKWVLLDFFGPKCPHCVHLVQPLNDVIDHFSDNSNIIFAKINGNQFYSLTKKYEITGYPELILFKPHSQEVVSRYFCRMDAEHIIKWLNQNIE